jgi:short-subunit dehydrogenase
VASGKLLNASGHPGLTLITGASSGIGLELARVFAAHGHDLILVSRRESKLREVALEISSFAPVRVDVIAADLSRPGEAEVVYERVARTGLNVDILVNNAGAGLHGDFIETPLDREIPMIQLNAANLVALTKHFLGGMVSRRRGYILNVSSTAAFQPGPHMAVYYATKSFVWSFSRALRHELRSSGVRVTVLCPGPVRTGFLDSAGVRGIGVFRLAASPQKVAREAYRALAGGSPQTIPGALNRVAAFFAKIMPVGIVVSSVDFLLKKPSSKSNDEKKGLA